jgi:hypothetical protein
MKTIDRRAKAELIIHGGSFLTLITLGVLAYTQQPVYYALIPLALAWVLFLTLGAGEKK